MAKKEKRKRKRRNNKSPDPVTVPDINEDNGGDDEASPGTPLFSPPPPPPPLPALISQGNEEQHKGEEGEEQVTLYEEEDRFMSFGRKTFQCKSLNQKERTGLQITLYNLTYVVPARRGATKKKKKEEEEKDQSETNSNSIANANEKILLGGYRKLCGTIDPGQMVALMGASGAGKTTLLDIICHRKTVGRVSGLIIYDGREPKAEEVQRDTGYVEQFETLWNVFTVHEMLLYCAMLGMSSTTYSVTQKKARVLEVIRQLGLDGVMHTKIGSGIRTGEGKKVSVAIGLLNNPRALFFDEPTTGLDSSTAYDVMALVKALADEGRTVLVTLHQPSGQIFDFFTTVLLLSRDLETKSGNIVYFGDSTLVLDYFTNLGYHYDTAIHDNVPEFFTDIISGGVAGPTEGNKLMEAYENSDLCDHNLIIARDLAQFTLLSQEDDRDKDTKIQKRALYGNNILQEIAILLRFKGSAEYRDIFFLASRIFVYWLAAVLIVSLYANTPKSPQGLIVILVIFHIVVLIMGCMTLMYIPELLISKPVFIKETKDGLYRVLSYCVSRLMIESSSMALAVIGFSSILYWPIKGFMNEDVGSFFFFMFTVYVFSIAAMSVTFALSAPSPSMELGLGAVAIYMLVNVAMIGMLNAVPPLWGWFSYISIMRWGWFALMINNFGGEQVLICKDVPNPLTTNQLVDTISSFNDFDSIFNSPNVTSSINLDNLVCGVLNTATNERSEFINATCPNIGVYVNSPAVLTSFNCSEEFVDIVTTGANITGETFQEELGDLLLNFFPVGTGYDARTKLVGYGKWDCVGFLALIWCGFAILYYGTSLLSLRLVKR